ncbi:hypothetical protein [Sphingopyxis sp.]|uniref:hypothetical protein n=1 Tax=Sphingopyxis sp. TaxID=1908224 RepID=UPI0025E934DC|nr:hypothetical protein [Sphingopyxis sp.]
MILQALATIFFIADVAGDIGDDGWSIHLLVETGATVALIAGVVFGALQLRWLILRARLDETGVATARGAMADLIRQRFLDWQLTGRGRCRALRAQRFRCCRNCRAPRRGIGDDPGAAARIYAKAHAHS